MRITKRNLCMAHDSSIIPIEWPNNLEPLAGSLLPAKKYSADLFIDRHTFFPFVAPFLSDSEHSALRNWMRSGSGGVALRCRGLVAYDRYRHMAMKYCPVCVPEDRKRFGETYWHRLHQIRGVSVCPSHEVLLETSPVQAREVRNNFISADSINPPAYPRPVIHSNPNHGTMLAIARDISWLLDQARLPHRPHLIRLIYLKILNQRGFTRTSPARRRFISEIQAGRGSQVHFVNRICVRRSELWAAFKSYYSDDLLAAFGFRTSQKNGYQLFLPYDLPTGVHPLGHLLFIRFLGHTVRLIFESVLLEADSNLEKYSSVGAEGRVLSRATQPAAEFSEWPIKSATS
jgi:hypothetical protein